MKIRKAIRKDENQVIKLLNEYDKYEYALDKRHKPDSESELKKYFNALIKDNGSVGFVVEDDSKIVGFMGGEKGKTLRGKNCRIHQLIISKEVRGKGYGKKLLKHFEKYFKEKGCKYIQSFVLIGNKKVLKFYDRLKYSYNEEGFIIKKNL